MYATIRRYKNAGALAEAMTAHRDEVQKLVGGVSGFVSYYATRDGDEMTSITVCNDKAGCEETSRRAAEWVRDNVQPLPGAPDISGGDVFIDF